MRVSSPRGEVEVEGEPAAVRAWFDELYPEIAQASSRHAASKRDPIGDDAAGRQHVPPGDMPESFGEFLHGLTGATTDIDRMLAAAYFKQSQEADRVFSTRAANDLLLEQGIRLSNPSMCVRRLVEGKRAFRVAGGSFRVSDIGIKYLNDLRTISV
ncbi:MAG: hypothetical protein WD749_14470 [Phycisphaerales bacterium]